MLKSTPEVMKAVAMVSLMEEGSIRINVIGLEKSGADMKKVPLCSPGR